MPKIRRMLDSSVTASTYVAKYTNRVQFSNVVLTHYDNEIFPSDFRTVLTFASIDQSRINRSVCSSLVFDKLHEI
jgi:hypothetical protein